MMRIDLKPQIEALLEAQVAAGHFASVEDAVTAAVLGLPIDEAKLGDLTWARPYVDQADAAIDQGQTLSESDTDSELERRFGKL